MSELERTEPEGDEADDAGARPALGTRIDRFTILDTLGAGGMGIVVAAHDPRLDRNVALKLLGADAVRASGRERLLKEGQAMARLSHPNVVAVHEAGSVGDEVFLVMELVEGETLRAWLASAKRAWREILDAFVAAGRGLAAAHASGLVHRDFKPDNVLVGADGRVRVTDFGLALAAHEGGAGSVGGTPLYMSPEQHAGGELDARADQWAFCVSLYEALWGRAPFPGDSVREVRAAVERGELRVPPAGSPVPGPLRAIVLRGLRRDPSERFPSMDAVVEALEAIPRRRRQLALAGAALGVAGVAGAAAFVVAAQGRTEPDRCRQAAAPLATVWNDHAKTRLRGAIAGVQRAGAAATADRVVAILDERAGAWKNMRIETCAATWKRGTQSQALLDLRMRCLDGRLVQLGALVTAMSANADAETVDRGVALAASAMPLDHCADEKALGEAFPPPEDPARRARVDELQRRLEEAFAQLQLGRYPQATELMTPLLVELREVNHPPQLARGLMVRADLHVRNGEEAKGDELLREGIQAAALARDSLLEADLWRGRMLALARDHKFDEALSLVEPARVALVRAGNPARERALLLGIEATTYLSADRFDEAKARFEESLALQRSALGADHPDMVNTLQSLSTVNRQHGGELVAAERYAREALAVSEKHLGRDHPEAIVSLTALADSLEGQGKLDDASAALIDALARAVAVHGEHAPTTALTRNGIASLAIRRQDYVQARAMYEAALPDLVEHQGQYATALLNYCNGWVSSNEGKEWGKESEGICTRARDAAVAAYGEKHPRVAIANIQLATARMMQGHAVEAEADFRRAADALGGHPYRAHALNGLGLALTEQGKYAEAIATCRELIAFMRQNKGDPRHIVEAHVTLTAMYADWGKKRETILEGEKALVLAKQPGMPEEYKTKLEGMIAEARKPK